jgi:hypothetical protein
MMQGLCRMVERGFGLKWAHSYTNRCGVRVRKMPEAWHCGKGTIFSKTELARKEWSVTESAIIAFVALESLSHVDL